MVTTISPLRRSTSVIRMPVHLRYAGPRPRRALGSSDGSWRYRLREPPAWITSADRGVRPGSGRQGPDAGLPRGRGGRGPDDELGPEHVLGARSGQAGDLVEQRPH